MMRMRRWISLFLAVMLCVGLTPITTFAADENVSVWDGSSDTAWYTGSATEYNIDSAAALAGVSELAAGGNNFQGITLNLTTDVDLAGLPWTPIGSFKGTFNGNNHTVANMSVDLEKGQSGFFEELSDAIVENLMIEQANVVMEATNDSFYQGVIAGWALDSEIKNCGASGKITADISGSYVPCVGGFIGSGKGNTTLTNCWSSVAVTVVNEDLPAMVGGLVGQWEDAIDGAAIIDSYFAGSVNVADSDSSAAGILGAGLSFNGTVVLIKGCVSYGSITVPEAAADNAVHIAALDEYGEAENCMWSDDGKNGVVRLVVDWGMGQANPDPDFDETLCGRAVGDFSDSSVIEELNTYAQTPGLWALGLNGYPVFARQTDLIRGDYTKVEGAKAKVPADLSLYTDETAGALQTLLNGINYDMSMDEQAQIDTLAQNIEAAITALTYREADYSKVDAAIAKAEALNKGDYKDFSAVETAVNAVVRGKNITEQAEVDAMAQAIENAIASLEKKQSASSVPSDTSKGGSTISPKTGDDENTVLWIYVMLASGIAMTGTAFCRKKRYSE